MTERLRIRTKIREILLGISDIKGVYSTTENQTNFPFVTWGIMDYQPGDTKTQTYSSYTLQLDVWDRSESPAKVESILDQIRNQLHRSTLSTDQEILKLYVNSTFWMYDEKNIIHGVGLINIQVEE